MWRLGGAGNRMARAQAARGDSKKKQIRAAEQDRPDVAAARIAWRAMQRSLDPAKLVFIDETSAATNMARRYGRARRGERVVAAVPYGHRKTTTFVAGLRQDGLIAPLVLDGAMNGESFLAYVRQFLVPCLRRGDIVIMDNLSSHKSLGVRDSYRGCGCNAAVSAALFARFQSDRAGIRKTESASAQGSRAHGRCLVGHH